MTVSPLDYEMQQSNDPYWKTTWRAFPQCSVQLSQFWLDWCSRQQWPLLQGPSHYNCIVLVLASFIINRYADLSLRELRTNYSEGNSIPHGYLFEVISCPNYLVQCWIGFVGLLGSRVILFFFSAVQHLFPVRGIITRINFLIIQLIEKLWYHLCIKQTDKQIDLVTVFDAILTSRQQQQQQ